MNNPKPCTDVVLLAKTLQGSVTSQMLYAVAASVSAFAAIRKLGDLAKRAQKRRTAHGGFG